MIVAIDFETFLIGPDQMPPKAVCLSLAWRDGPVNEWPMQTRLYGNGDDLTGVIEALLTDDDIELVAHNAAFDMVVMAKCWPQFLDLILKKYSEGKIHCTMLREKLLCIGTHGRLESIEMPDGSKMRLNFHLAGLSAKYLGKDRSAEKTGEDAWRLRYSELDGLPAVDYPEAASKYAIEDSVDCLAIFEQQAQDPLASNLENEWLHVCAHFALYRMTCRGIEIDEAKREEIQAELSELLTPEKMAPLIAAGVLRPAEPPRPYKNSKTGAMTKGKDESINKEVLGELVETVSKRLNRDPKLTDTKKICTDDSVLTELREHDPILELYAQRQGLQKLVTTELPRIQAARVFPSYDALKETLRTSSFADKLVPSLNIQNVDPRVRPCFKGPLLSVDYSGIELCCLAQKVYSLGFGSTLRDQINSGVDPHAFLGAQIAATIDEGFGAAVVEAGAQGDQRAIYEAFMLLKTTQPEFFSHYRTFAKPTGLGYPGGLGPETFISYAKATYGLKIDLTTATNLRKLWHDTYPEMKQYFEWVNNGCSDPRNRQILSDGDYVSGYAYISPLGTLRSGCTFCACANGAALQTPAAEGAKLALFRLELAYVAGEIRSEPVAFIHDEVLFRTREEWATEDAKTIERIMIESMREILPDVQVRCESKLMMEWHKEAKPVYANGRLVPWVPKEAREPQAA